MHLNNRGAHLIEARVHADCFLPCFLPHGDGDNKKKWVARLSKSRGPLPLLFGKRDLLPIVGRVKDAMNDIIRHPYRVVPLVTEVLTPAPPPQNDANSPPLALVVPPAAANSSGRKRKAYVPKETPSKRTRKGANTSTHAATSRSTTTAPIDPVLLASSDPELEDVGASTAAQPAVQPQPDAAQFTEEVWRHLSFMNPGGEPQIPEAWLRASELYSPEQEADNGSPAPSASFEEASITVARPFVPCFAGQSSWHGRSASTFSDWTAVESTEFDAASGGPSPEKDVEAVDFEQFIAYSN